MRGFHCRPLSVLSVSFLTFLSVPRSCHTHYDTFGVRYHYEYSDRFLCQISLRSNPHNYSDHILIESFHYHPPNLFLKPPETYSSVSHLKEDLCHPLVLSNTRPQLYSSHYGTLLTIGSSLHFFSSHTSSKGPKVYCSTVVLCFPEKKFRNNRL